MYICVFNLCSQDLNFVIYIYVSHLRLQDLSNPCSDIIPCLKPPSQFHLKIVFVPQPWLLSLDYSIGNWEN